MIIVKCDNNYLGVAKIENDKIILTYENTIKNN